MAEAADLMMTPKIKMMTVVMMTLRKKHQERKVKKPTVEAHADCPP